MIGVFHIKGLFSPEALEQIKNYYSPIDLNEVTVRESNTQYHDKKWYNRGHIDEGLNVLHLCAKASDLQEISDIVINAATTQFRSPFNHDGTLNIIRYDIGGASPTHYDGAGKFTGHEYTFIGLVDDNFKGGEFVINGEVIPLELGDGLMFQINFMHSVEPVLEGVRVSIVARLREA
jgi:hypothetical protein